MEIKVIFFVITLFIGLPTIFVLIQLLRNMIKKQIDDAEKLKEEAKMILSEYEKKISNSNSEINCMINNDNLFFGVTYYSIWSIHYFF